LDNIRFYNNLVLGLILIGSTLATPTLAGGGAGLAAALYTTLSNHPALNGKQAEVYAKGYVAESARALRYPSLTGQLSSNDKNVDGSSIQVRQPLWAFGRIDSTIAHADADTDTEKSDLLRIKRQLIEQTAVAYTRVLGVRESMNVAVDNMASFELLHQQIKHREVGQRASVADVKLAWARLLQAQAKKNKLKGDLLIAENELLALTQTPVGTDQIVPKALTQLPTTTQILALAMAQSADVSLKAQRIVLAHADVEREKSASMPTIYLQADHYNNDNQQPNSDTTLSITLAATIDGFGFAATGRNNAAGARLQAAKADLYTTQNEVRRLVNGHAANRDAQHILIGSQEVSVQALKEILASYQRQYSAGLKTWLDVLNIQRELTEQRLQLVQADNDWLIYTLKLAALTGSLDALAGVPEKPNREPNND
jgi:adhesin transport system outer membrane protein